MSIIGEDDEHIQYRNPIPLPNGRIDCEILFPKKDFRYRSGWMPFTADPNDREELGRELHKELALLLAG